MDRKRKPRTKPAKADLAELLPKRGQRLAHVTKMLDRHARVERVLEVQRARKLRHG